MIGHKRQFEIIKQAINGTNLSHVYLITGAQGVGKDTFAKHISKSLFCTSPLSTKPCHECASCVQITAGYHSDFAAVAPLQNKAEIGIDQIRDLKSFTSIKGINENVRIVIIDGADKLTEEAANSLLKILEEPLGNILFFLLASEIRSVLPTIRSRSAHIHLAPVPLNDFVLSDQSKDGVNITASDAWRESGGYPGAAIKLMSDPTQMVRKMEYRRLFIEVINRNGWQLLKSFLDKDIEESVGDEFKPSEWGLELTSHWLEFARDLVMIKLGLNELARGKTKPEVVEASKAITLNGALRICEEIINARRSIARHANVKLTIESLVLNLMRI